MDHADEIPEPHRASTAAALTSDDLGPPDLGEQPADEEAGETGQGVTSGLLDELAKAMHAAADQERERIATVVAEEAAERIERTRARASLEAQELRRLADDDLQGISEWADAETERIRTEAAQRADARRAALDEEIRLHEANIDAEIQRIDGALADYRATLQQFFSDLTTATDPEEIARRAGALPPPPDLDAVRADASAASVVRLDESTATDDEGVDDDAATVVAADVEIDEEFDAETQLIGVMDPTAAPDSPADTITAPDDEPQPVAAAAGRALDPGASRLLRTISTWTPSTDREDGRAADGTGDQTGSDRPI